MRISRLLTTAFLSTFSLASSAAAQTVIPVEPFRSVELRHGGSVTVRHGSAQRVTIVAGDAQCTRIRVDHEQRLVIDNHAVGCRRHQRVQIEVITPELTAVAVSNGGHLQSAGAFPAQATIEADVEQGGRIDIRSIAADAVEASVYSGGGIFTTPRKTLAATVTSGGGITYWGDPRVTRSVRDGGFVAKGRAEDAGKPLPELGRVVVPVAPIPPG